MSPEIAKKAPYSGLGADIWAIGVVLYIICAGVYPFFGEFEADLFRKIQTGKYRPLPAGFGDSKIRSLLHGIF